MPNELKTYYLGTAVKISTVLNVDTVTSAKITIEDGSDTTVIDSANMTKEADKVYYYIFQSTSSHNYGTFEVKITIVYNGYTSVVQDCFELVDPDLDRPLRNYS